VTACKAAILAIINKESTFAWHYTYYCSLFSVYCLRVETVYSLVYSLLLLMCKYGAWPTQKRKNNWLKGLRKEPRDTNNTFPHVARHWEKCKIHI